CGKSSGPPATSSRGARESPQATDMTPTIVNPECRTRQHITYATGKVEFNEDSLVRVHAPATGRVLEVFARPADVLERGTRLVVIDSADLGTAKSDYAKAAADVERSAAAVSLTRELFAIKAVAQKELRETENDERKAVAERERAASRLETLGVSSEQFA